ncbi:MAG: hypothetical protein JW847_03985 [Candidatus Omnitrophica bacterium]|nr:hypothetical protein [Candidatus Omnitrophota bacterium]
MKKYLLTLWLTLTLLNPAFANSENLKIITLKSDSTLKGKVIELREGIYTLETPDLGQIKVPESNILSIASFDASVPQDVPLDKNKEKQKLEIMGQVNQAQQDILSDPGLITDFQGLVADQEIQSLISDPKLLDDVLSYDPDRIDQNPSIQRLMQNEKIQALMLKIQQKMSGQE